MTNKVLALVAVTPTAIFFALGLLEGVLGYPDNQTILPIFVEDIIGFVGLILTLFALYRLYRSPEPQKALGGVQS